MKAMMWKSAVPLLATIVLAGCATIMGKSAPETSNVRSTPDQASVVITDESGTKIFEGKTPTSLPLEKKKGFFSGKQYEVKILKEGYSEKIVTVDTKLGGWYAGNLLFGGVIGFLIIDPATGAMWTLNTNEVNVSFDEIKQGTITKPSNATNIVLLQDVPLSLRDKMIRVQQH